MQEADNVTKLWGPKTLRVATTKCQSSGKLHKIAQVSAH